MKDFIVTSSWYQNWVPVIARILLSAIFILGGVGKLMNFEGSVGFAASVGVPFPDVAVALALVIELLGGIFLLVGFKTKVTAMIVAVTTLVITFYFHNGFVNSAEVMNGLKNLAIVGGLLLLSVHGPCKMSLDRKMRD